MAEVPPAHGTGHAPAQATSDPGDDSGALGIAPDLAHQGAAWPKSFSTADMVAPGAAHHLHDSARLPDLANSGFRAVGGRLLATDSGPAALVVCENGHGKAMTFHIRSPAPHAVPLPHGQRRQGELAAAYWSGRGCHRALVSRANKADIQVIQLASLR